MCTPETRPKPVRLFCSYAHEDDRLRKKLLKHLSPLLLEGRIQAWHDRLIKPGQDWEGEIDDNLLSADIILLLLSASFTSSRYCTGKEMRVALERARKGEIRLLPIVLRPIDWQGLEVARFQALPKDGKPITSWSNRDEAFKNVAVGVRQVVNDLSGLAPASLPEPMPVPTRKRSRRRRTIVTSLATALLVLASLVCWQQARGYLREGDRWLDIGRGEEAEAAYAHALRFNPISSDARFGLEKARVWQGRGLDVVGFDEELSKLRQRRPADGHVHLMLGNLAFARQQPLQAISEYQQALALSPNLAQARWGLGVVLAEAGTVTEALDQCQRAVEVSPMTPRYRACVASLLARQGKIEAAIEQYRAVEQHPLSKIELAKLLWIRGDLAGAKTELDQAITWLKDPSVSGRVENRTRWSFRAVENGMQGPIDLGVTSDASGDAAVKTCYARLALSVTLFLMAEPGANLANARQEMSEAHRDCSSQWGHLTGILLADLQQLEIAPTATPAIKARIKAYWALLQAPP
jgi:tetratricopeptide (TPR) repeat protein